MMDLSLEICEREIVASKAAMDAHEDGLLVNSLVNEFFKKKLKEFKKK